ncbi:hypothetical protein PS15m_005119 [Mucor circinelloides]
MAKVKARAPAAPKGLSKKKASISEANQDDLMKRCERNFQRRLKNGDLFASIKRKEARRRALGKIDNDYNYDYGHEYEYESIVIVDTQNKNAKRKKKLLSEKNKQ